MGKTYLKNLQLNNGLSQAYNRKLTQLKNFGGIESSKKKIQLHEIHKKWEALISTE